MGALVKAVAGPRATLTVLAGQNRDLHALQAKPTMMHALRGADLVVAIGAELEVGWLPVAIRGAANPKILPGTNGYFEAAAQVPLLDAGGAADRAMGDVHPVGNPHVNMDPVRMVTVARALSERLALIDPAGASEYRRRAESFAGKVDRRLENWRGKTRGAPGVVLYHCRLRLRFQRCALSNVCRPFRFRCTPITGHVHRFLRGIRPTGSKADDQHQQHKDGHDPFL